MTSTGNDIVALKAINIDRTKQIKFYKRILSVSEKHLYDSNFSVDIPLEIFVWLLWSIKEASYKYLQRTLTDLVFSPTKVIVSQMDLPSPRSLSKLEGCGFDNIPVYKSVVRFGDSVLHARSMVTDQFIFSVVNNTAHFRNTFWGIQLISHDSPQHQSDEVRTCLLKRLKTLFPGKNFGVGKSEYGYPTLSETEVAAGIPISLAHHGCYVSYTFQMNKALHEELSPLK